MKLQLLLSLVLFPIVTFAKSAKDSSITKGERIEIVNKSFDRLVEKLTERENKNTIWDTLTPLLIGAGLTLLAQFAIEFWRTNKERQEKIRELVSKGRAKTYLITQILKDLAMYKVHKQYYLRAFYIAEDEDSFKKHYEKGQQQRETEIRLDDNIAEYFQLVTEYSIVAKNIDHFQKHFQSVFQFTHPKSSKFADCNTAEELVTGLEKEEARLNTEYKKLTDVLENIQTEMQ